MLWRSLAPGYRRLLRSGAAGEAMVHAVKPLSENTGLGAYANELTLHVRFDDGSETTVTRVAEVSDLGGPGPGTIVPVRYDPRDHRRIEIDVAAVRERKERARREAERAAIEAAEESIAPDSSGDG